MPRLKLFVGLTILASSPSYGTRWEPVARNEAGIRSIDADSVIVDGPTVTVWLRTDYAVVGKKGAAWSIEKWMHDCAHDRAKLIALSVYKANGSVITSGESPRYMEEWQSIPPNSASAIVHDRVCSSNDQTKEPGITEGPTHAA